MDRNDECCGFGGTFCVSEAGISARMGQDRVADHVRRVRAELPSPGLGRIAVAQDGGDILFDSFDEETGVLALRMRGACAGCPSSAATLKAGVEQMMKHYVPEVTRVEQTL